MYSFYLLLHCICFIFVKCPWALREALMNKLYCHRRYSHWTSVYCCGVYPWFCILLLSAGLTAIHGRMLNYSCFGMPGREGCTVRTDHSRICISLQFRPLNCHFQCASLLCALVNDRQTEQEKMTGKKTCLDRVLKLLRISLSH